MINRKRKYLNREPNRGCYCSCARAHGLDDHIKPYTDDMQFVDDVRPSVLGDVPAHNGTNLCRGRFRRPCIHSLDHF
jgi:hypothetical protein